MKQYQVSFTQELIVNNIAHWPTEDLIASNARICTGAAGGTKVKTLQSLVDKKHTRPLELAQILFEFQIPIFLDRQLVTHRMASSMAQSARYGATRPGFYLTADMGESEKEALETMYQISVQYGDQYEKAGIDAMRARELARNFVPQNQVVTRRLLMNFVSFANFYKLRSSSHAQKEMQLLAELMLEQFKYSFPIITEAFIANDCWR
jgi:thymidylate synthase (FAD)